MTKYNHKQIEEKWQKRWNDEKLYKTREDESRPKFYILDMFPYPSGEGLHVGHPKGYIATDIFARYKSLSGFNVLHPMGWDAFGLPTENYALKHKVHPRVSTAKNIATFKSQLEKIGFSYDWEREINTTDPEFYKWTQWIFTKMFERGLAFESYEPIIWCPSCKTGLAMEDLEDGKCERCGSDVERKPMRQWVLRITDYAERMLNDLDKLPDWESSIKEMQRNWIGKSVGAEVNFQIKAEELSSNALELSSGDVVTVFTTRPDTLFGATYFVIAPEHPLIKNYELRIKNFDEIQAYVKKAAAKSDMDRTELNIEKTGVKLEGLYAVNPVNGEKLPIFVADYVMMGYGTGAIMAVPAHDERDFAFAQIKNEELRIKNQVEIKIITVVDMIDKGQNTVEAECFAGDGIAINSDFLNGLKTADAKEKMIAWLEEKGLGRKAVNYKLKDWVFSRQRYWGEPIPIIHCEHCKEVITKNAKPINFYDQDIWSWLVAGKKTVETRALNPEEKDRYFGDIKDGDHIQAINKKNGQEKFFRVKKTKIYKDLVEFSVDKEAVAKTFTSAKIPNTVSELEKAYSFTDDYVERINKNGLIAWELQSVSPGIIAVPDADLPVRLPEVEHYEPSGTGESPLATIPEWVNTACPQCGGPAKRETNTMPQWAGSSWYYLRFIDPKNDKALVDINKEKYWSPVDFYVGGAEHATRHLIYARFWHKFLFDIGAVNYEEPFTRLQHVGLIMAEDGRKMSKRWGNVINPDEIVEKYGADAMRVYEMFMGPFSQACAWSTNGLGGAAKFLERIYNMQHATRNTQHAAPFDAAQGRRSMQQATCGSNENLNLLHKTIKKVGEDIEGFKFNTAISAMMILVNALDKERGIEQDVYEKLLIILAPFAPHLAEEIWSNLGHGESIFKQSWPAFDPELIKDEKIQLVLQVNGKLRDTVEVDAGISEDEAKKIAVESGKVMKWIEGKEVLRVVYVGGKLVNVVVK